MQLTSFTDYTLRLLIFLGQQPEGKQSNIREIAEFYSISNNHLSKIVYELGKLGVIKTNRGRNGGILLAKDPADINIGEIVQHTESPIHLVECFDEVKNRCVLSPNCSLKSVFNEALHSYFQVLYKYTLRDILPSATSD